MTAASYFQTAGSPPRLACVLVLPSERENCSVNSRRAKAGEHHRPGAPHQTATEFTNAQTPVRDAFGQLIPEAGMPGNQADLVRRLRAAIITQRDQRSKT
jgi:hypothetical protein